MLRDSVVSLCCELYRGEEHDLFHLSSSSASFAKQQQQEEEDGKEVMNKEGRAERRRRILHQRKIRQEKEQEQKQQQKQGQKQEQRNSASSGPLNGDDEGSEAAKTFFFKRFVYTFFTSQNDDNDRHQEQNQNQNNNEDLDLPKAMTKALSCLLDPKDSMDSSVDPNTSQASIMDDLPLLTTSPDVYTFVSIPKYWLNKYLQYTKKKKIKTSTISKSKANSKNSKTEKNDIQNVETNMTVNGLKNIVFHYVDHRNHQNHSKTTQLYETEGKMMHAPLEFGCALSLLLTLASTFVPELLKLNDDKLYLQ
jgi:hypothetical protein